MICLIFQSRLALCMVLTLVLLLLLLLQIWGCNQSPAQRFRLDFIRPTLRALRSSATSTVTNSTALPLLTREEAAAQADIRGKVSSPPIPSNDGVSAAAAAAAAPTLTAADSSVTAPQAGVEAVPMTPEEVAAAAEVTVSPPRPAATADEMGLGA
jgi:hypothetical protein